MAFLKVRGYAFCCSSADKLKTQNDSIKNDAKKLGLRTNPWVGQKWGSFKKVFNYFF